MRLKPQTAPPLPKGEIKTKFTRFSEKYSLNPPLEGKEAGSGGAKAVHHSLFTYPHKPKPNPALSPFFEKLEQLKKELIKTDH